MEQLIIDVPDEYQGTVIQELSLRKGELVGVHATGTGLVRLEFTHLHARPHRLPLRLPHRDARPGRDELALHRLRPWRGELPGRERGSLVSQAGGEAAGYSLENLQNRAMLFVSPWTAVYEGMIVGENSRGDDMLCNPTKSKQMGNYRQSTKEIDAGLKVPRPLTLEIGARVDRRRRARRGHAQDRARAQAHPQHRAAQEGREAARLSDGRRLPGRRPALALPRSRRA